MLEDRYGLRLSTTSEAARDAYVTGVDRLLAALPGAQRGFDEAIAEDPGFALAHCARARVLQLNNRIPEARECIAGARKLAERLSTREQGQVAIFDHLLNGRSGEAMASTGRHLEEFPRDAVALSPSVGVFGLYGFSGRVDREQALAALLERVADHYGEDWWFLSAHGFALIENGDPSRGRELVEQSLERMPRNANAAHIHAHALYELAADDAALGFLDGWLPEYPPEGQMHCHLWWHLALMRLYAGDVPGMWQAFENYCLPGKSLGPPINVLTDGVSLLWRARLAGFEGDRGHWQVLREFAERQFPAPGIFVDVHYGFCLAALGDDAALAAYIADLRQAESAGQLQAGGVVASIVEAAAAFVEGDMRRVQALLLPALDQTVRIGGSRAQRDLVLCTLLSASLAIDDLPSARTILRSRAARGRSMPITGMDRLAD